MSNKNYNVYYIVNSWNNKLYIGITNNFKSRKNQHFSKSYRKKDSKKVLYRAMNNFEESFFTMYLLMSKLTKEEALFAETFLINMLPSYVPYGYNKATDKFRLKNEKIISEAKPDFFKEIVLKKEELKDLYCENSFPW